MNQTLYFENLNPCFLSQIKVTLLSMTNLGLNVVSVHLI